MNADHIDAVGQTANIHVGGAIHVRSDSLEGFAGEIVNGDEAVVVVRGGGRDRNMVCGWIRLNRHILPFIILNAFRNKGVPVEGESIGMQIIVRDKGDSEFASIEGDGVGDSMAREIGQQGVVIAQIIETQVVFRTQVEFIKVDVDMFSVVNAYAPVAVGVIFVHGISTTISDRALWVMGDDRDTVSHVAIRVETEVPASIRDGVIRVKSDIKAVRIEIVGRVVGDMTRQCL